MTGFSQARLNAVITAVLRDIRLFSQGVLERPLRPYQLAPALAIVDSVVHNRGLTFAVVMSRQAGKNELSAHIEAYLMTLLQWKSTATLVKASPTFKPQTINSRQRLYDRLNNRFTRKLVHLDEDYIIRVGKCRCFFFSAHPGANVVGATATVLLECDEAQDVDPAKWSKDFAPMGASTNVTTVFYGTIWTARTLLAQVIRQLRQEEAGDGVQRVFTAPWTVVAESVPAYGDYVRKEIARLGSRHPIVATQYLLEEIDDAGRLLTAERLARMKGDHPRARTPAEAAAGREEGDRPSFYVITVDVAGEDEELQGAELRTEQPRRDSTVATLFEVDLAGVDDPLLGRPIYRVLNRYWWTGMPHHELYSALLDLVGQWHPLYLIVDATGVGAGVASYLSRRLGRAPRPESKSAAGPSAPSRARPARRGPVLPFEFTAVSKSDLGWAFVAVVEGGRFKDYVDDGAADTAQFWREAAACEFEVLPGPGRLMRWGVADPRVHDDMLVSAALVSLLDDVDWRVERETEVIPPGD
jgi:hypothetical protein